MSEVLQNLLSGALKHNTIQEQSDDQEIQNLRSELIKKVDCAITVLNHIVPYRKILMLNAGLFGLGFILAIVLGGFGFGFAAILGIGLNILISKKIADQADGIKDKYRLG